MEEEEEWVEEEEDWGEEEEEDWGEVQTQHHPLPQEPKDPATSRD